MAAPPPPCPFTADPVFVTFKLPTKQRGDEIQRFTIKNPTAERATYKVGGTQIKRFIVIPQEGFIEAMASTPTIEIQPKKIDAGGLKSYTDKFLISIAPAPADQQDAEALWKGPTAPVNPAILTLDIKVPT